MRIGASAQLTALLTVSLHVTIPINIQITRLHLDAISLAFINRLVMNPRAPDSVEMFTLRSEYDGGALHSMTVRTIMRVRLVHVRVLSRMI